VQFLVPALGFGVASGAIIALGALGFTLQFGLSDTLNVAYGAFVTVGAFLGYFFVMHGANPWIAMVIVAGLIGVLSVVYYEFLIRRLISRGIKFVGLLIATLSAGIIIEYVVAFIAGPQAVSYGSETGGTVKFWEITLSSTQVVLIVVAATLMLAVHLGLTLTTMGRKIRATAANRTLARSCGIRTDRVTRGVWLISGALCGITGVALAMTTAAFDFTVGSTFLVSMIAAAVVGGIGQPYGAMLGGLVIGLTEQVSAAYWNPAYSDIVAFALLIVVLLVRPRGLFSVEAGRHKLA
jgi:branched-subunit amino acid ABC-type transport system permease component